VTYLGGGIRVSSEPGRGTRFEIDLPVRWRGATERPDANRTLAGQPSPETEPAHS
jgi:hypothetical protein